MHRRTRTSGWLAARERCSHARGLRALVTILLADPQASLTAAGGVRAGARLAVDRPLARAGSRSATLAVAVLASILLCLIGASLARASSPGGLTSLTPAFVEAGLGATRVAVSPDGKNAYATNRGTTTLSQYSRSATTGVLAPLSPATVGTGGTPEGVVVSPDGTSAYVANRSSGTVSQYSREVATGKLTPLTPATVTAEEGPTGVAISPDGKSVYTTNATSATVSEYSRNTATGRLTALTPATIAAGANAHGIVVSPDGRSVYATNYEAATVSQYSRNTETGALAALSPATVAAGVNPHDLAISPDGKSVYVADSSSPGKVAQFTRNAVSGTLAPMATAMVAAGEFTEGVVVSPDGNDVYATNELSSTITQYFRNAETGALIKQTPASIATEANPEGIAVSPDGKSIYAANHGAGNVSQYARNTEVPPPPTVLTGAASGVGPSSVTVSGTVNPNGQEVTECRFEYGATTSYGASSPCTAAPGSGSSAVAVSASVGGLSPNTTYHFRLVATNAGGTSKGSDESVKTLPNAPTVETTAATALTQTSATLNATVNPNGASVSDCHFEYGTTEGYGSSVPCSSPPGSGTIPVAVSASLGLLSLAEDTTYHFRIVATNAGGTGKGPDGSFKTLPNAPAVLTGAASAVTSATASLNGTVNPNGGEVGECELEYGTTTAYGSSASCTPSPGSAGSPVAVSAAVTGLAANATYHFRIVAMNAGGTSRGADETLTTLPNAPAVVTTSASAITQTSATLSASVNPNGGTVGECRFEYGTTELYGSSVPCSALPGSGTSPVAVSATLGPLSLAENTTYHFRIVATNAGGTSKGADETLKTLPNAPKVTTKAASAITRTAATLNASVNPNGGEVGECRLEYGTTSAYGSSASCGPPPGSGTSTVSVSAALSGLTANTAYHFRVSAANAGGTSRGADETLKTLPNPPAVTTKAASAITQTSATLTASVNPNGGEVSECKLEYGTTSAYGSSASCSPPPGSGTSAEAVSASVGALSPNSTYHFRIVAMNAGGTSRGADETLNTLPNAPTVTTKAASAITQTAATLNASVNPNGGEVGECKLEYGTTSAYGSSASCAASPGSGTSPVAVSAAIGGLAANTTYHFRVVASNPGGISNGADETLRTLPNAPALATGAASAITQSAATLNATVNPDGGEVSDCHFEYGTTEGYGSSAPCSSLPGSGSSPVGVSAPVTGLVANTTYHFRISATNPGAAGEGSDGTFTTLPNPPTAEAKTASAITQTTATLNATVNPNGGEVNECKLEYGTTEGYGSSAPCSALPGSGAGPVAVSASVSGLSPNTGYHFRLAASNPGGKSSGPDETLQTLPNPPTVEAKTASAITRTTATLNATINPNGGAVGECRFEYGTTEGYGSSVPCSALPGSGASPVATSASVAGLAANTTYHFRVVAGNAGGTSRGADETLRTPPSPPTVVSEAASAITQTTAVLNASVNPNGGEVNECKLEYGTTAAYGSSASCTPSPGSGAGSVAVSASVGKLSPNTTYHFRIVATNPGGSNKAADETLKTLPNPPAVVTSTASAIAQTAATLNATVNPDGGEVGECKLEYGTTSAYGSSSSCAAPPGSGTSPVAVSAAAGGLAANTTYHFRIVASNPGGTSNGADETLRTLPIAPAVVTKAASAITQTAATFSAAVNPNGGEVGECQFEYGTTEGYGSSAPCSALPGSGASPVAVSASLALLSLAENTTYHFRIVAANAGGTSRGSDQTLKTLPNPPAVVTSGASSITQIIATLNASVNPNGGEVGECKLEYGTTSAYGSSAPCTPAPGSGTAAAAVSAALTGLTANSTYHFRIMAANQGGASQGSDETFKTLPDPPSVTTEKASAITQTAATLNATVNPNAGAVGECRFEYGTTEGYGSSVPCSTLPGSGTSQVAVSASLALLSLSENTTYHFRVLAANAGGTASGADQTFRTLPNAPTLVTKATSAVTQISASLNATVNPNAGAVSECQFEYGTSPAYGSTAACTPPPGSGSGPVAVSASVSGLNANTSYHFRIVARNPGGTSSGPDETLRTLPNAPTVETGGPSALAQTSATLNASVNPNGGEVSECKLEYGTSGAYGLSAPCTPAPGAGGGPVAVSATVTGLTADTTYHFRVSATNAGGTSRASDETLKTLPNPPTVLTKAASTVTQSTASLSATVNPNGGEVGQCKLEYGTTSAYGSNAPCSSLPGSGFGPVAVSAPIGGLSANTTYHFRIVAANAGGTGTGSDETLETLPNPPTVVTNAASSIAQTTATLGATVNPNGGEVGECKLEYGPTPGYGASVPCAPSPGSGTGPVAVSAPLSSLTANTTYHFRIVAANAGGTGEGSDQTLRTLPNPPTVVTNAASSITQTAATLNASVNPNGGEVGECKLEYGATSAYGSSAPCTAAPGAGTAPVAVSAPLSGLTGDTTYHFRIVAANAGGTGEGSDQTLKTLPGPTVVTEKASAITQTGATLSATVNPNGGEVSECELEYGTTTSYESSAPCTTSPGSGTSPVAVSAQVSGLTANTAYHVRISATNPGGTSRGSDQTFRTLPNAPAVVTEAASSVTQSSVTLNATVNPNGEEVGECRFEYGTSEGYGSSAPCSTPPGSGTSPVAVSASISGIAANTTFHARIVSSNAGGTSRGNDQLLTTLAVPTPPQQGSGNQGVLPAREAKTPPTPDAALASSSFTISSAGVLSLKVTCPASESSCIGTVTLQTLTALSAGATGQQLKPGKASVVTLARGSFTVAGGQAKAVTLHLSATARALLARMRVLRVRATIAAHDAAGAAHTAQTTVTLRAPKATAHH